MKGGELNFREDIKDIRTEFDNLEEIQDCIYYPRRHEA